MKKSVIVMMSFLAFAACAPKNTVPALDLTYLDTETSPKVDFYQYSTGGWQANNPLRPEFPRYGSFDAIRERTQENLNALFESMTTLEAQKGTVDQKISDLYKMALDSTTRNALGAEPIQPYIAEIQAVQTRDQLVGLMGKMGLYGDGGFFDSGVQADLANSEMQVLYLGQGGLGMGDRDYYLKEENKALYDGYQAFLVKVLSLAGIEDAQTLAQKDMAIETELARISWTREQNRDMQAIYNPMSSQEIYKRWPGLRFDKYCAPAGIPDQEKIIVEQPSYFDGLSAMMEKADLETLKAYLLCQFVAGQAGALSDDFYTVSWEFFSIRWAAPRSSSPAGSVP